MKNKAILIALSWVLWYPLHAHDCKVNISKERTSNDGVLLTAEIKPSDSTAQFKWSTEATTSSIRVTKSGEYCVRVQFRNGCVAENCMKVELNEGRDCRVEIRKQRIDAGMILLPVFKSSSSLKEWAWSNGKNDSMLIVQKSGKYCLRAVFANGCVAEICEEIVFNDSCRLDIKILPNENAQVSTRKLCAITSPGQGVKAYLWSNGATTECIRIENPGEYCVKVTYADGCVLRKCIQVGEDPACRIKLDTLYFTDSLGGTSIGFCVVVPDSPAVRALQWSTGSNERCIRVDRPGEYCVKVLFANGCVARACVNVERPDRCKVEIISTSPVSSDQASVTLCARTAPGDSLLRYKWSTGDTTACIRINEPGKYCVRVINSAGCVAEACIEIPRKQCRVEIQVRPLADETFKLTAHTNSRALTYKWNTGDSTNFIVVKEPGKYCVRVAFEGGCVAEDCAEIEAHTCDVAIKILPNGKLQAITEGQRPFTYAWSNGATTKLITPESSGEYCVTVTDAQGCETKTCINYLQDSTLNNGAINRKNLINQKNAQEQQNERVQTRSQSAPTDVSVFPNPASQEVQLRWHIDKAGTYQLQLFNPQGQMIKKQNLALFSGENNQILKLADLPSGLYVVRITDGYHLYTNKIMKR